MKNDYEYGMVSSKKKGDPNHFDEKMFFDAISDTGNTESPAWDYYLALRDTNLKVKVYWDAKSKRYRQRTLLDHVTEQMKDVPNSWWQEMANPRGKVDEMIADLENQLDDYFGRERGKRIQLVDRGSSRPSYASYQFREVERPDLLEGIAVTDGETMYIGTKKYDQMKERLDQVRKAQSNNDSDMFKSPPLTKEQQEYAGKFQKFLDQQTAAHQNVDENLRQFIEEQNGAEWEGDSSQD